MNHSRAFSGIAQLAVVASSCLPLPALQAAVTVSDPSAAWTPLMGNYDYLADQQKGSASGDIVGAGSDYGFFVTFYDNGNVSATDGTWGFRLRLDAAGGTSAKPDFDRIAWLGIDADLSGSIDVFLGLNMQGSSREIGIYSPGSGTNTSPKTTSISSTAYSTYALTADNYNYRPVDYLTDGGTTNDLTPSSSRDPDYYASFMVPFADVVAFLAGKSINITDQSPMRFVATTSTQANSINQDLGGVNGGVNSTVTWENLGGFTQIIDSSGNAVPEPSSSLLLIASLATGNLFRRRR
jgi:hypothetical protein